MAPSASDDPAPRLRVVRPAIPDAEKVFMASLDVTLRVVEVAGLLTPAINAQVQTQFAAYLHKPQCPVVVYNQLLDFLCRTCLADRPLADAHRFFGRQSLARYGETILGRVLLATLPLLGMERMLRRAPHDFTLACNYGTRWVTELGPHHWQMDFADEIMYPEVLHGVFEGIGGLVHLPGLEVTHTLPAPRHITLDLRW